MNRNAPNESSTQEAEFAPNPNNRPTSDDVAPPPPLPLVPLAGARKHPFQVSPVPDYQTDRYRLVAPFTRL